jgi:hypothetical protein
MSLASVDEEVYNDIELLVKLCCVVVQVKQAFKKQEIQMASRYYDATILAPLRDDGTVHSFLVDLGDGRKARLPLEELRTRSKGATARVLGKGSKLPVTIIHENKGNVRLVVSEQAAIFNKLLDRMTFANGWRDQMPEEHYTDFVKGRLRCTVYWASRHIKFHRRSRPL